MNIRTLSLMAVVLLAGTGAQAQPQGMPAEPVVVVSGEGIVRAAPDRAWVSLSVESRSKNPKEAQAQNAKNMTRVQEQLLKAGVPKDAIRTIAYGLQLESDWVDGKQVPRGYVARNTIEVRLDAVDRVGEIIDVAITNGANSVHGVRFDVKDRDALEREALKRAAADARSRAEATAAGVGAAIGRIMRIEQPSSRVFPAEASPMMMREAAQDSGPSTPVVAGEIEVRASVVLTATLK